VKRTLVIASVAAVLIFSLLAGVVLAFNHQPVVGKKLVGIGRSGYQDTFARNIFNTEVKLTNPDCAKTMTINKISIIRGDGTVMYEGSFWVPLGASGTRTNVNPVLNPHQCIMFPLNAMIYKGTNQPFPPLPDQQFPPTIPVNYWEAQAADLANGNNWLQPQEAAQISFAMYTVEIGFTTKSNLSLAGWIDETQQVNGLPGDPAPAPMRLEKVETPMLNLTQSYQNNRNQ
jgi:hypothetical protein